MILSTHLWPFPNWTTASQNQSSSNISMILNSDVDYQASRSPWPRSRHSIWYDGIPLPLFRAQRHRMAVDDRLKLEVAWRVIGDGMRRRRFRKLRRLGIGGVESARCSGQKVVPSGLRWLRVSILCVFNKTGNAAMGIRIQTKSHKAFCPN